MTNTDNVISIAEWKAQHQRKQDQPLVWTYYKVVPDPNGGWRLELTERKHWLELD